MTFGVIGFGRFGQLWADTLMAFGTVKIFDVHTCDDERFASLEEVVQVDMLFLVVPISKIGEVCTTISPLLSKDTVVVDVASVKVHPAKQMHDHLPDGQPIIATHPLFGPDSVARLGLVGRKIVVCELNTAIDSFVSLLARMELQVILCTPEEHDKQMARSQALIHFIGRGLTDLRLGPQDISTPGYESLLAMNEMVENDTWQLFEDMQRYNPFAKEIREQLRTRLSLLEERIMEHGARNMEQRQ